MKYFILLMSTTLLISGCHFLAGDKTDMSEENVLEEENIDDFIVEEDEMDEEDDMVEMDEEGNILEMDEEDDMTEMDEEASYIETNYDDTESIISQEEVTNQIQQEIPDQTQQEAPTQTQEKVVQAFVSLNKIMKTPYMKAGQIVNAVYIARPNEDMEIISQKIYGRNEVDQLLKINNHLKNRSIVVGDKIYYNSPRRPDDTSQLLFFYEDNNVPPSYYTLSPGENIRNVASQLLGHPKSWKEIWAINPNLQSKGEIQNSLSIMYWPQGSSQLASNNPTPAPSVVDSQMDTNPETPINQQNQQMPLEEETTPLIAENEEPIQDLNPTPPPTIESNLKEPKGILQDLLDNIEIIAGIILFLVILYLIIRIIINKGKQRDFDYTATNME